MNKKQQSLSEINGKISSGEHGFIRRVLITFGIGTIFLLLAALLWFAADILLLVFSSILLAILLHDASSAVERWARLPYGAALAVVLLTIITVLATMGWLLAPQVIDQVNQLAAELPNALRRLHNFGDRNPMLQQSVRSLSDSATRIIDDPSSILMRAGSVFSRVIGMLGSTALVLFLSIYFAAKPHIYTDGIVTLLPPEKQLRGKEVLHELGEALSLWLRGKLLSMAIIGITTTIGLSLLDVPLPLALGMVTGLLDFIPYLGPILAAIPALLIAFSQGPILALYVVLLFFALQSLEGYLLLPLVERKTVALPPALTITMQVIFGLAFGLVGVALATPLTAVLAVLIAMLYVQDVLGNQVTLPANKK